MKVQQRHHRTSEAAEDEERVVIQYSTRAVSFKRLLGRTYSNGIGQGPRIPSSLPHSADASFINAASLA